jgi:hypothetical protein
MLMFVCLLVRVSLVLNHVRLAGTSSKGKLIDPMELMLRLPSDRPVVFVFGAISRGEYVVPRHARTHASPSLPPSLPPSLLSSLLSSLPPSPLPTRAHRNVCVVVCVCAWKHPSFARPA